MMIICKDLWSDHMRCLSIRKLKIDFFSSSVRGNHGGGEGVLQDSQSVLKKRIYKQIRRSSYHMSWTRLGELMWATEHNRKNILSANAFRLPSFHADPYMERNHWLYK